MRVEPANQKRWRWRPQLRKVSWALCLLVLLLQVISCSRSPLSPAPEGGNLLAGLSPTKVDGVRAAQRLTDGVVAVPGDHWRTNLTSVFTSNEAFVEYDLGKSTEVKAYYLQGDNNDTYLLWLSEDGTDFKRVATAFRKPHPGMRERHNARIKGRGRYVRITARGGDRSFSLSEVQLFAEPPAVFPPKLQQEYGVPAGEELRSRIVLFGASLVMFALLAYAGAPLWWTLLCLVLPALGALYVGQGLVFNWPVEAREVSMVRAVAAAVALLVVARETLLAKRFPANSKATIGVLGVAAGMAFMSFYNLGHPQFWDHKNDEPGLVHNFDMRVYYPVAKYFKELRFDGLYMASVAAYADDDPRQSLERLGHVSYRDLKTHRMVRTRDHIDDIKAVKARFSPERWQEFVVDMRYFRETMGVGAYLGSMHDHGGNATPVWLSIAHLIFAHTTASNTTLLLAGALDPLLLLFTFFVIGRTFGARTMLVSMVVFGANDFYMFGSNWGGATLRHDWMAYLGLGLCALRSKRWGLGGALLALAALIRAFPAIGLAAVVLPSAWWLFDYYRAEKKLPSRAVLTEQLKPLGRIVLGASVCVVLFLLFSSLLLSFSSWPEWYEKVKLLSRDPHVNHVSLRSLFLWAYDKRLILQPNTPLLAATAALFVALVVWMSRGKRPEQAAVLGLCLIPVVFYPANYYIHFIFLVPLFAIELNRLRQLDATNEPSVWRRQKDAELAAPVVSAAADTSALATVEQGSTLESSDAAGEKGTQPLEPRKTSMEDTGSEQVLAPDNESPTEASVEASPTSEPERAEPRTQVTKTPPSAPLTHRDLLVWCMTLGICVAQYWTVFDLNLSDHFRFATLILFCGLTGIFLTILGVDLRKRAPKPVHEEAAPSPATS